MCDNILEEPEVQPTHFTDCKVKYLIAENKLMNIQYVAICNLITVYKQVLDKLTIRNTQAKTSVEQQDQHLNDESVEMLLKAADELVQKCVKDCQILTAEAERDEENNEASITPGFFMEMVVSYQKNIADLKMAIHQREILLQELETDKNHIRKRVAGKPETTAVIKAIQSYDIYPKLAEKCRNEIVNLKIHKVRVGSKQNKEGLLEYSENSSQLHDKTVKMTPGPMQSKKSTSSADKTMTLHADKISPFEKTILIYKKKKLFNEILEDKVIRLKNRIKEKEVCNQLLKKRLEVEVWENLGNITKKHVALEDEDPACLSMINESMRANNLDFSVDISRVIGHQSGSDQNGVLGNILEESEQK